MKFLAVLFAFFALIWGAIAVHYFKFDREARANELQAIAKKVRDVKAAQSFISEEYKDFVYAK